MPERITPVQFWDQHLDTLQQGDTAFHGMLHPKVYPGNDQESHEKIKQGIPFKPAQYPYYQRAAQALDRGVYMQWFHPMPEMGQFGYNEEDIVAMRSMMQAIAGFSSESGLRHDVRIAHFSAHQTRLERYCGGSAILERYYAGIRTGNPQSSFWMTHRRRPSGLLLPSYVGIGGYENKEFAGYVPHTAPDFPQEVVDWTSFWIDVYENHAEKIIPPEYTP